MSKNLIVLMTVNTFTVNGGGVKLNFCVRKINIVVTF
jgi:hypothetical protein